MPKSKTQTGEKEFTAAEPVQEAVVSGVTDTASVSQEYRAGISNPHAYFTQISTDLISDQFDVFPVPQSSVVLVVIDALNAKHIGAYGYTRNTTPAIDGLAKQSVVFTQWISNSSWTRPSFTTILTGVPKSVHQMELTDKKLPQKLDTMAERFKRNGYQTAAFIGNPLIQQQWRYDQGFDHFEDVSDYGNFPLGEVLVDSAVDWMTRHRSKPFFIVLFLTDTHAPYAVPESHRRFSSGFTDIISTPKREVLKPFSKKQVDGIVAAYDDELRYADIQVGELIQWLKDHQLYDTTTFALIADHGEIFGQHNCFQHAYHMWEPVLRVPFMVHSPAVGASGYSDTPLTHTDLMPTLLHLCGLSSKTAHGDSAFLPSSGRSTPFIVSGYDARGVTRRAARNAQYKLVRYEKVNQKQFASVGKEGTNHLAEYPSLLLPGPRYELYNLHSDPGETINLYGEKFNAQSVPALDLLKKATRQKSTAKKEIKAPPLDDETFEALKAAGYIQ